MLRQGSRGCCGQYTEGQQSPTVLRRTFFCDRMWPLQRTAAETSIYALSKQATTNVASSGRLHLCSQWEETHTHAQKSSRFVGSQKTMLAVPLHLSPTSTHFQIWLRTLATVTHKRGTSSVQPLQTVTSSGVETRGQAWGSCDWFKVLAWSSAWRWEWTQIPVCWVSTLDHSCSHKLWKALSLKLYEEPHTTYSPIKTVWKTD